MKELKYTTDQVSKIPEKPGIYKFHNSEDILIYVGKAKNLKKRVASYFNKNLLVNRKTKKMVSEISKIPVYHSKYRIRCALTWEQSY